MLKKTITYEDFNGESRTEDFYFNLTEAELLDMQMGTPGGFVAYVDMIVKAQDAPTLIKLFREIVLAAYGEKSLDGRSFIKTEEVKNKFRYTNAFSKLYMELATNDVAASDFMKAIIPQNVATDKQ